MPNGKEVILMEYHPHDEKKFEEYRATCEIIQKLLEKEIPSIFEKKSEMAKEFAELAGVSESRAKQLLSDYRRTLVTKIPPGSREDTDMHLERLATLYKLLKINPNDKIVELTQKVNPLFKDIYRQPQQPTNKYSGDK